MAHHPAQNRSSSKNYGPSLIAAKIELSQLPSMSCPHSASKRTPPTPTHPYLKTTLSGAGMLIKLFNINTLPFRTGYQTVNTTPVFGLFLALFWHFQAKNGTKRGSAREIAVGYWLDQKLAGQGSTLPFKPTRDLAENHYGCGAGAGAGAASPRLAVNSCGGRVWPSGPAGKLRVNLIESPSMVPL